MMGLFLVCYFHHFSFSTFISTPLYQCSAFLAAVITAVYEQEQRDNNQQALPKEQGRPPTKATYI